SMAGDEGRTKGVVQLVAKQKKQGSRSSDQADSKASKTAPSPRKAPPKGKDPKAYVREWRQHQPPKNAEGLCSYCERGDHTPQECYYLMDKKPYRWKPYKGLWCYYPKPEQKTSESTTSPSSSSSS